MNPGYRFFRNVIDAIAEDRLSLPSLPDVALRASRLCSRPDVTAGALAIEIARDAGLAGRVVKIANSAGQGARVPVRTLQQAITRLGFRTTRLLVSVLSAEQLFRACSPELSMRLRRSWANTLEVTALSRTVARRFTGIDPDEAMLAGLVHEIGILPIIQLADDPQFSVSSEALEEAAFRTQASIGRRLLAAWHFPQSMIEVPEGCTDFRREHDGPADLADVVCVSLLHARPLREGWLGRTDRRQVRAYARLGMDAVQGIPSVDGFDDEVRETQAMLAG